VTFLTSPRFGHLFSLAVAVFLLASASSASAQVDLFIWQPTPQHARLILPRVAQESAQASIARYLKSVNSFPDMVDFFKGPLELPLGQVTQFQEDPGLRVFILANDAKDLSDSPARIQNLSKLFFGNQASDVLVVPIVADAGLSQVQKTEFREKVATSAELVLALGGEDIVPEILGQINNFSVANHPTRDRSEALLLRTVLNKRRAFVAGICRGHQLVLSLLSRKYKLVQDLQTQLSVDGHRQGFHDVNINPESAMIDFLPFLPEGQVNTLHHQGFYQLPESGPVEVVATDHNGIVEGTVFKNDLGMTFQFHPELMKGAVANQFASLLMGGAQRAQTRNRQNSSLQFANSCRTLF
jgi:gamma-glutamyl-gamma-aminobutyrate hydrolase PuuD